MQHANRWSASPPFTACGCGWGRLGLHGFWVIVAYQICYGELVESLGKYVLVWLLSGVGAAALAGSARQYTTPGCTPPLRPTTAPHRR